MRKEPGINRRHFVGAAAAAMAASPLAIPSSLLSARSTSMNAVVKLGSDPTALRPFQVNFPESDLTDCAAASWRRNSPTRRPSTTRRRACSSP